MIQAGAPKAATAVVLFLGLAGPLALPRGLAGQTAHLLRDLDSRVAEPQSPTQPQGLFAAGSRVFFNGFQPSAGSELWATDGTAAGTELLADICPGPCSSAIQPLAALGPVAFFLVGTQYSAAPSDLWRSDGTRPGTYALDAEITFAGPPFATVGNVLYFSGCAGSSCGLARSDGSRQGTRLVAPTDRGFYGEVSGLAITRGRILFAALNGLWATDGTPAGTHKLQELAVAQPARKSPLLTATADRAFLVGGDPPQLWTSDGTAAGTRQLTHFAAADAFQATTGFKVAGSRVYFVANDVTNGAEIWTSDGTAAGTVAVTGFDFYNPFPDAGDGYPISEIEVFGNRVLFAATDGLDPVQLWKTDGTPASTAPLAGDLRPASPFVHLGSRAVFLADGGPDSGSFLWSTDGTAAGTRQLPGDLDGGPPLARLGGAVFVSGSALWRTDGTAAGTRRLSDVPLRFDSFLGYPDADRLAELGGRLFFPAVSDGADGEPFGELWTTDGRPGGTRPVAGDETGTESSAPQDFAALGDQMFFWTASGALPGSLWRTAGTAASTVAVATANAHSAPVAAGSRLVFWSGGESDDSVQLWSADAGSPAVQLTHLGVGPSPYGLPALAPLGGRVFFLLPSSPPASEGLEIWASDGTAAGTARQVELPDSSSPTALTAAGGRLFFLARSPASASVVLWTSDGTAAGTRQVSSAPELDTGPDPQFTAVGSLVFFRTQYRVWRTDGSAAGTVAVSPGGAAVGGLAAFGGALYFLAEDGLWRADAGPDSAVQVRALTVPSPYGDVTPIVAAGGRLFFAADDGVHGLEPWVSDGTAAGTSLLQDIAPGDGGSVPAEIVAAGGRIFFTADDGLHGDELWVSDGTAAGTRLLQDIAPGALSSSPAGLTVAGDRLYFAADDALHGREPWSLQLAGGSGGCQASATVLCAGGGRFEVEIEWRDFQGNRGPGTAVPLTADTGYFWFFSPANVEVVVKVLDARSLNQAFWVFYGALSSVEYTLTVTDTQTGLTRRYANPLGELASVGDTLGFGPLGAFDTARAAPVSRSPATRPPADRPPSTLVAGRTDPRAATGSCAAAPGRLCLSGGRFAVTAAWKDFQGHQGVGTAVPLTADTGTFWFFDPANVEVVTKVLDGRAVNGKFWLFYGALSSVEYTLTVTDTATGAMQIYRNASGNLASVADTGAF